MGLLLVRCGRRDYAAGEPRRLPSPVAPSTCPGAGVLAGLRVVLFSPLRKWFSSLLCGCGGAPLFDRVGSLGGQVDVSSIDLSSTMLGYPVSVPIYITSCALGRLAHPDGEVALARAAGVRNVIQLCPTLASATLEEMTEAAIPGQTQFLQLYVNHNRAVGAEKRRLPRLLGDWADHSTFSRVVGGRWADGVHVCDGVYGSCVQVTEKLIRRAEKGGIKAIFVTVDAPQLGRREKVGWCGLAGEAWHASGKRQSIRLPVCRTCGSSSRKRRRTSSEARIPKATSIATRARHGPFPSLSTLL